MDLSKTPSRHFSSVIIGIFLFFLLLGGCVRHPVRDGAPKFYVDVSKIHDAVPHYLPKSQYGNPASYVISGKRYRVLQSARHYAKRGIASWYGTKFHGRLTSTHERYDMLGMTAASPELPIPCFVRVTNLENGRQIIVKVNDRGPFATNRILDLTYVAAKKLGYANKGTAMVEVTSIDMPNPIGHHAVEFARHRPRLYLQVGAFRDHGNAIRLQTRLNHITHRNSRITEKSGTKHFLYHVQIGPLNGVDESDQLQQAISRAGLGRAITVIS